MGGARLGVTAIAPFAAESLLRRAWSRSCLSALAGVIRRIGARPSGDG